MRFFNAGGLGLILYGLMVLLEAFFSFAYACVGKWHMFAITTIGMVVWGYCFFKRLIFVKNTMHWIKQAENKDL